MRKATVCLGTFLFFLLMWHLYDNGISDLALFPVSLPVYIFMILSGNTKFVAIPLFLYPLFLFYLFELLKKRPNGKKFIWILFGLLFIFHLLAFQLTLKAFHEMGEVIGRKVIESVQK